MRINVTKEELFKMIEDLRERLDLIEGRPRGSISMTDLRHAVERNDKATVKRYWEQFSKEELQRMNSTKGGSRQDSALCGASAGNL